MRKLAIFLLGLLLSGLVPAQAPAQAPAQVPAQAQGAGFGVPLKPSEIAPYDITVFPDGRNLPLGRGSVADGAILYRAQCAYCHGEKGIEGPAARLAGSDGFFGWSDPLRILRIQKYPVLILSVGARWPHATSIFDYIRRAMPHSAPKSLTTDQVYAATAYLLYLNQLLDADAAIDERSLPKVKMPAAGKTYLAWPLRP